MTSDEIRRNNLAVLLQNFDTMEQLANKAKIDAVYARQIKNGQRPMGGQFARKIEAGLELDEGWMDTPHDSSSTVNVGKDINDGIQADVALNMIKIIRGYSVESFTDTFFKYPEDVSAKLIQSIYVDAKKLAKTQKHGSNKVKTP